MNTTTTSSSRQFVAFFGTTKVVWLASFEAERAVAEGRGQIISREQADRIYAEQTATARCY